MSLPPETITVKRKRRAGAEDEQVNFLRVEETKRQRSGAWYYRRKQPDAQPTAEQVLPATTPGKPIIHASQPGDEKVPLASLSHAVHLSPKAARDGDNDGPGPNTDEAAPRRFHLTRFSTSDRGAGRGPKRTHFASAVFVERSVKRKKTEVTQEQAQAELSQSEAADVEMEDAAAPLQKRPGARARAQPPTTTKLAQPQLPPSLANRQFDTDTEALSREMDSWAMQHIAQTLARQEEEKARQRTPGKYRPKAPAERYSERHPGVTSPGKDGSMDVDHGDENNVTSETDDEDYVVETYVRVPAHTLKAPVPPGQLGVLVFDQGSDVEYFYGLEDDSEEETLEDEEDSNDENHYTADYPEDEVESDDEYGRDVYRYRTGNASDEEEFDDVGEDEAVRSEDEAGLPGTKLWREQREVRARLGLSKLTD